MNVASLELCKELYELSGWDDKDLWHDEMYISGVLGPFYDLGYLMRRLPQHISVDGEMCRLELHPLARDSAKWAIGYMKPGVFNSEWHTLAVADTPEDAACKLAIELIKQGVLNPKEDNHGE